MDAPWGREVGKAIVITLAVIGFLAGLIGVTIGWSIWG